MYLNKYIWYNTIWLYWFYELFFAQKLTIFETICYNSKNMNIVSMSQKILSFFLSILLLFSSWSIWEYHIPDTHAWVDPGFAWFYYSGTSGDPYLPANFILSRVDTQVYFDWGTGSPDASIPNDDFTARWTWDLISDQTGVHTFRTRSDDGIRVYIDGNLVINNWTNHAPTYNTGTYNLTAGTEYDIVVEFYERWGWAVIELDWQRPGDSSYIALDGAFVTNNLSTPLAPTNITLSNSTLYDNDPANTNVWFFSTEDPNPNDTHTYSFVAWVWSADNSKFSISGSTLSINSAVDYATQNSYSIRVQTNDGGLTYEEIFIINVINSASLTPWFCGAYYNGTATNPYQTSNLILERADTSIDFNWGTSSPDPSIPNDNFTARWEWIMSSDESWIHNFRTLSDDGVRVYVDGILILNNWTNHGPTYNYGTFNMQAWRNYSIVMEFYEAGWWAVARLNWEKPSGGGYGVLDQNDVWYIWTCNSNDTIAPTITSTSPSDNMLFPRHDFDILYSYSDDSGGVWIDISNSTFTDLSNNIAPNAHITATVNTVWWSVSGTWWIANGIKSTVWALNYEYHSDSPNAFIEFEWPTAQKIWDLKIYNRTDCCAGRIGWATIELYDETGNLLHTHTIGNTDWVDVVDIDFNALWEIHEAHRLRINSQGPQSYINIREIEIFPLTERLKLYKWDGTTWWDNIASRYVDFWNDSFSTTNTNYPTLWLPYWKYKKELVIQDLNGNTTTHESVFYIDEPSFNISTPEIDLWELSSLTETFSDTVTITVQTVWAAFEVFISPSSPLSISWDQIPDWDGTNGFWYQNTPFSWNINTISNQEVVWSQNQNINTNGEKNTYTFEIQLWALVNFEQSWGEYLGNMDFWIDLEY